MPASNTFSNVRGCGVSCPPWCPLFRCAGTTVFCTRPHARSTLHHRAQNYRHLIRSSARALPRATFNDVLFSDVPTWLHVFASFWLSEWLLDTVANCAVSCPLLSEKIPELDGRLRRHCSLIAVHCLAKPSSVVKTPCATEKSSNR